MKILLFCLVIASVFNQGNIIEIIKNLDVYLKSSNKNTVLLKKILESGSIDGKYSSDEIQGIFNYLLKTQPDNIRSEKIGKTYLEQDIYAYFIS